MPIDLGGGPGPIDPRLGRPDLAGVNGAIDGLRRLSDRAAVVVAYGQILPAAVLEAPRLGSFNLHASLLPRQRGSSEACR